MIYRVVYFAVFLWCSACNGQNAKVSVNPKDRSITVHSNGKIFTGNLGQLGLQGSVGHSRNVPISGSGSATFRAPNGATGNLQISGQKHGPTIVSGSASGPAWQGDNSKLHVGGTFSRNINSGVPASVGGNAVLSGPRGRASVSLQRPGGAGTTVGIQGQGTIWSNPSGSTQLTGGVGWSRNFHGPQGTGPANFGVGLNFRYAPRAHYPPPYLLQGPCNVKHYYIGCAGRR